MAEKIFDPLRRKYVALTPEEQVRQHFVRYLMEQKNYPSSLLINETQLNLPNGKKLRCDTVLLGKDGKPCMIVEYKAPSVKLTQRVFDQITVYNMQLHVDYLIVSNGVQNICCKMDYDTLTYTFLPEIPYFHEL